MKRMKRIGLASLLLLSLLGLTLVGVGVVTASASAQPAADSAAELETFVPSEKLPADSAISFPVDI